MFALLRLSLRVAPHSPPFALDLNLSKSQVSKDRQLNLIRQFTFPASTASEAVEATEVVMSFFISFSTLHF